ncbi:amino acid aminotransferase [Terasakiella sp. A23]|uniref:amino acid aminotransferase n=1 Tax=Terasakiella sp. FCG-A23 TaxID=3080561 RepID=UPI0029554126|nr:amino acid aminotransferase [Terasakiella sp. A23]MDV7339004.1 amino acid aminotransferase [Terasakiella sp. A23]
MFQNLAAPQVDAIIALMAKVQADDRADKIDLSVGIYKDEKGETPVMKAVSQAEDKLHATQSTKKYVGMTGDAEFNKEMTKFMLGDDYDLSLTGAAQAPGGSGALRLLSELVKRAKADATIWVSDPTWPNHHSLLGTGVGLDVEVYPYFDYDTQDVLFDDMCSALGNAKKDDVVVLHGCCHNPTGRDMSVEQWDKMGKFLAENSLIPLIDFAYLGFGDGLEEDVKGMRALLKHVPTAMIAVSCSKNFGVYRDRVGCSIVVSEDAELAKKCQGHLGAIARGIYSMPPDHGAAVVRTILQDAELTKIWKEELTEMRGRVNGLRAAFSDKLRELTGSNRWDFIANQRGMFTLLGLNDDQIAKMRDDHAIYVVKGGRINVAGLQMEKIEKLAKALVDVTS